MSSASNSDSQSDDEYEVEKIIDHKKYAKGKIKYFVKWKNYDSSENTWEPEENLVGAKGLLEEYWNSIKQKPEKLAVVKIEKQAEKTKKPESSTQKPASPKPEQIPIPITPQPPKIPVVKIPQPKVPQPKNSQPKTPQPKTTATATDIAKKVTTPKEKFVIIGARLVNGEIRWGVKKGEKTIEITNEKMKAEYPDKLFAFYEKCINLTDAIEVKLD